MRTNKTATEQAEMQEKELERADQARNERWLALLRQNQQQVQPPTFTPPGLNRPRR